MRAMGARGVLYEDPTSSLGASEEGHNVDFFTGGGASKAPTQILDRDVWIGAGTTMARRTLASYGAVESKKAAENWTTSSYGTTSSVDEDEDELGTPTRIRASLA